MRCILPVLEGVATVLGQTLAARSSKRIGVLAMRFCLCVALIFFSFIRTSIWHPDASSIHWLVRTSNRRGEYARDEDGDGFCEVHVNTMEGFWSLLRSWLRLHRGISQEKLPLYLGFFEFVHNIRQRGKALLHALIEILVT